MPAPDPTGRLAALQAAAQGQQASPGANFPAPGGPSPDQSPLGPNVEPDLPEPLQIRAQVEGQGQVVSNLLARLNVLEQTLVARGVVDPNDLNASTPPAGQMPMPGMGGQEQAPQSPPAAPVGAPPQGAPPQPMGAGPRQPY